MKKLSCLPVVLILIGLLSVISLSALEFTPNQILFKTSQSLDLQRGRTGLTAFDAFLNQMQAQSITPVKSMPGNRWFSAKIAIQPNWDSVKNNTLRFEGIDIIQPNYLNKFFVTPNDPWYSLQQLNLVELPQAWNYSTGSNMIVVGVVDSGILFDHPDLMANIYTNPNEIPDNGIDDDNNGYIDDVHGWDFADAPEMSDQALGDYIGQDNDPTDENFHGTHVSGIIGAVSNNGIGISGVCWNVKIMPLRAGFRTTSGTGFLQDDDAAAAVIYGADMGCSVMNLSWGDPNYSPIIADACNYAYESGVTLIASAGNDPGPFLSYPAKLSCVISVGAIDPYKNLAGFSSYGPELDLVAPGQMIYSTYKSSGPDMYKEMSGTSMSAPYVTGAAALLKSVQPNMSPEEVKSRILTTTDDLGADGFDSRFGHGLLNTRKMMESLNSPYIKVSYPADNIGVSSDFDITGTINCDNFFRYSVMRAQDTGLEGLVWKDVLNDTYAPVFYEDPVVNGVLARFHIADLMPEGPYVIRIQYESTDGSIFNIFRSISLDQTAPQMVAGTFQVFKRYDGQNVRYYAGALFDEPVRSELIIYSSNAVPVSCFPAKMDSIQVWPIPNTIPPGPINVEISATNECNLVYQSAIMTNIASIDYELVSNYGYESREIGTPLVPLNQMYDMDANGIPEFPAMELPTSGYGIVKFYEPTDSVFTVKHTSSRFWPLDMGNTNGSGQELLSLNLDTATLYETTAPAIYPDTPIWTETGISGGILADYNGDGIKDIMLIKNLPAERVIQLYKRTDATHVSTPKITLHNTSQTNLRNMFVPTIICQNFDNDGMPDILTADTDGDVMIYEVTGAATYNLAWSHRMPIANTYYLTSGDYDGNGNQDFFVGGYNTDLTDPNQSYWFFEGFTKDADNHYISMGYVQFNQVMSQNAIQSFDVDNDGKQEIILSLSPNLYILKYINGKFTPVFHSSSMRSYQIAAWRQNNQNYFLTNQNDAQDSLKAVVWTKQQPFTGPPTPVNLVVSPLNGNEVSLTWQFEDSADAYRIYRKEGDGPSVLLVETSPTSYIDTSVTSGVTYQYAISTFSKAYSTEESIKTQWVTVTPMPKPVVTGITMIGSNELRITFDQVLSTSALNPGCYKVDHDIGTPLSVNSVLNQHGIQLRFRNIFPEIVSPDLFMLKLENVYGLTGVAPIQSLYSFSFNPDYVAPVIGGAEVQRDKKSVIITISETVSTETASLMDNYILTLPANDASNRIESVSVNDNKITVIMKNKLKYSNKPYFLTIQNITDLAGNKITPNQNSCRFTLADIENLDKLVVYPNPVKVSANEAVSFLNFPSGKKGKLSIYNTNGDLVFQQNIGPFNQSNNNVTARWELTNQAGKTVSSGIYFYMVNMGDDFKKGKIAVLN